MTMKRLLAIPFVMACSLGAADLRAQSVTVTYDTFMQLGANEQLGKFRTLTPANRADLMREQVVRWRRLHAERLTPEQDQILAEVAEFIQPEQFLVDPTRPQRSDEVIKAFVSLEAKASRAFTPQECHEVFTLSAYLPQ